MAKEVINVTKTFLPSIDEYKDILKESWEKNWITNRGSLIHKLEDKIKEYTGSCDFITMTNGTLPIQIALKTLDIKGEVITTPFSYIATTSGILWENCTPVFVDIDPQYLTINEDFIESKITKKTTAILATHVFGNPCHIEKIEKIANKHDLHVIYDAAHCFGVKYKNKSIFNYGDISTCSFHATKIFHTGEGGALFSHKPEIIKKAFSLHNFGHNGPNLIENIGINAKISELQAAMGLSVLPYMDKILEYRKKIIKCYLSKINFENTRTFKLRENTEWNFSYFPIILENEKAMLNLLKTFSENNIFPRRYFYPSLNKLNFLDETNCKISENISSKIICLPLYHGLEMEKADQICSIINDSV